MKSDRIELTRLNAFKSEIEDKIKAITIHPSGKTYGQMLSQLMHEYVEHETRGQNLKTYEKHSIYSKVHYSISSKLGVKTQVFTKEEYIEALSLFKQLYKYNIHSQYLLNEQREITSSLKVIPLSEINSYDKHEPSLGIRNGVPSISSVYRYCDSTKGLMASTYNKDGKKRQEGMIYPVLIEGSDEVHYIAMFNELNHINKTFISIKYAKNKKYSIVPVARFKDCGVRIIKLVSMEGN